ncbi:MAG: hypothetical protein AAB337_01415 [Patescibacteria group bacterium]
MKLIASLYLFSVLLSPAFALAQGIDVSETGLSTTAETAGYGDTEELDVVVGRIIQVVLGFMGFVFFAYALYAGVLWMTSKGNAEKVKQAQQMITNGIIGLVIVSAAYSIAYFVITNIK